MCSYATGQKVCRPLCPPVPSYFTEEIGGGVAYVSMEDAIAEATPPPPAPCATAETSYEAVLLNAMAQYANYTTEEKLQRPRMSVVLRPDGRRSRFILLDGAPYMCRAVSYSPVPIGEDPSYHEPFGDYFTDNYGGIWRRDLALFKEMGANTVRLYAWRLKSRHNQFLDQADRLGLTVMSVFEMGTAEDTPVGTPAERQIFYARVANRLRISRHRAITAWFIGNELNGAWNAYVCEKDYEEKFLHFPGGCTFKDNATRLCELIDDACAVVQAEGKLCTTPWAGVGTPGKYNWQIGPQFGWDQDWGWQNWMKVCEGTRGPSGGRSWEKFNGGEEYEGVEHIDFWSANLYPGKDFASSGNFKMYEVASDMPLLVSEYGIDAYVT